MICLPTSDLSLFENLEQKLCADVSVSLLAELERELLRLKCELSGHEWDFFCQQFPRRRISAVLRAGGVAPSPSGTILDAVTADSFPARPTVAQSPGHVIKAWEYSLPVSRSLRARKAYFQREIAEVIRTAVQPRILVLGAGPMREADDAIHAAHLQNVQFVALESDVACQDRLRSAYRPDHLRIEGGTWEDLPKLASQLGSFDLIYSSCWLDRTSDLQASGWLSSAVEMLRASGRILAANFTLGSRDAGWIEACWNWQPHYRSEEHIARLAMDLQSPGIRGVIRGHAVYRDESGASAFLEVHSI